jgi:tetratricopeptide (TPR) repeat protein
VKRIGRYEVLDEIARGGMGVVYRARDPESQRQVAAKVLFPGQSDARFRQEIRSMKRLDHPAIVALHEVVQDDAGRDVVIMELVEGESLRARLQRAGPLPVDEALDMTLQLCEAVGYAHSRGVLHRDLKPDNVLVTPGGQLKLADFGLGKVVDQSLALSQASLTEEGQVLGSPAYMPPEQARGNKDAMSPRSDVYALGGTLYALLTGKAPFQRSSVFGALKALLRDPAPSPSEARPEVSAELDAVVLRCLAKAPEERYASVAELAQALTALRTPPAAPRATPGLGALALASLAGAVLAGLVGVLIANFASPSPALESADASPPVSPSASPPGASDDAATAEALYKSAVRHGRAERWVEARQAIDEAIRLAPPTLRYFLLRGRVRLEQDEAAGALEDLDQAYRLDPLGDDTVLFFRGKAKAMLGDTDGALEDYGRMIERFPDFGASYYDRGVVLFQLGRAEEALADLDAAVDLPGNVSPQDHAVRYVNRAVVRNALGDEQGAIEDLDVSLNLRPDDPKALGLRGYLRLRHDDLPGALRDLDASLRLAPDQDRAPGLHLHRAQARALQGDVPAALEDLAKTIELAPESWEAFALRAQLRIDEGDVEGAIEDLGAALRIQPGQAHPRYLRALARARVGRVEAAIEDLSTLLEARPDDVPSLAHRGCLRLLQGERPAAEADLRRALELGAGLATALWYHHVSGDDQHLRPHAEGDDWPAQLAQGVLGRLSEQALLDLAEAGKSEEDRRVQRREAHAHLGVQRDMAGDAEAATRHYEACLGEQAQSHPFYASWIRWRLERGQVGR